MIKKIKFIHTVVLVVFLIMTMAFAGCKATEAEKTTTTKDTSTEEVSGEEESTEDTSSESTEAESEIISDEVFVLKLADVVTPEDPLTLGLIELKEQVEKRTNGKFQIEVYPSGQLGTSDDVDDQIRLGANIASITDVGRLSAKVPEIGVLSGPYLVDELNDFELLFKLDFYQEILQELEEEFDMKVLAFNYYQGERNMLTKVPITKPEDLNGLKIRTIGTPIWMSTISAMGAESVALPWSEAYNAVQQKVIDGVEVQHAAAVGSRLYEVAEYYSKTGHIQLITALVINPEYFNNLPKEYQDILLEESVKAGNFTKNLTLDNNSGYENTMEENGMQIIEPDKELFKEATEKVYEELGYTDLKTIIDEALGK